MDKAPLLCRIKSNIIRKSPSAIMAGCNFGIFPSGKCIDCPEYNAWWKEFEWSTLKMVELKPEQIKAADVVEVRHGRWLTTDAYPHHLYCSVCYKTYAKNAKWVNELDLPTNYCPNCGARMEKEDEHEAG